jgi:UrcA family protein
MSTRTHAAATRLCFAVAAVSCAFLATPTLAGDRAVTVRIPVTTQGLDMAQPSGVRALYQRIRVAAQIACTHGNRVGLDPAESVRSCYETAVGHAIREFGIPELTRVYLAKHTIQDALNYGVTVPEQIAEK